MGLARLDRLPSTLEPSQWVLWASEVELIEGLSPSLKLEILELSIIGAPPGGVGGRFIGERAKVFKIDCLPIESSTTLFGPLVAFVTTSVSVLSLLVLEPLGCC